jgi:prepilin-type N-terminal cleavage/methylation domain-containing protein
MSGFTLFEVMVVIALFGMLIGLGLFMTMDAYRGYIFRSERDISIGALTEARSRAMANLYQAAEGVCYQAPNFIVFRAPWGSAGMETIPGNAAATVNSIGNAFACPPAGGGIVFTQLAGTTTPLALTVSETGHADVPLSVNAEGTIIW